MHEVDSFRRAVIHRLIVMVCFAAIAYIGFSLVTELEMRILRPRLGPREWGVLVVSVIGSAHIVMLIHELGHVFGGWLAGYRLQELIVGPLCIERERRGFRYAWNRDLKYYAGRVQMMPGRSDESLHRTALMLLFGPATSLGAGAITLVAGLIWLAGPAIAETGFRGYLIEKQLIVLGVGSIIVGLANLVPVSFSGRQSDGAKLWLRFVQRDQ